jgi:hypothetical protein
MTVRIPIVTDYNAKGVKQAQKSLGSLEKSAKSLGKSLGLALSTAAVVAFGKASVKAFMEDERAAASLNQTLKLTGNAYASIPVQNFIASLQRQTGVLDDELRPAFQSILTATFSVEAAQKGLATALDISAGTGRDLGTVAVALSRAYAKNGTSLTKLIPAIDKTVAASGDLEKINQELTKLYGGQASAAAETYAGKMKILAASAADAKEIIGGGLLRAIVELSGDKGMGKASQSITDIAGIAAVELQGLAIGLKEIFNSISQSPIFKAVDKLFGLSDALTKDLRIARQMSIAMPSVLEYGAAGKDKMLKDQIAAEKKAAEIQKKRLAAEKASQTNAAKQLALKKASSKFDLDKIQIEAALKGKINEEERLRLLLQQAILNEDVATAEKLQIQLQINQNKTSELAMLLANLPDANDPFADWEGTIAKVNSLLKDLKLNITAAQLLGSKGITLNAAGTNIVTPLTPNPSAIATAARPFPTEAQQAALYAAATPEQQTLAQQSAAEINSMFTDIGMITDSLFGMPLGTTTAAPTIIVNVAGSVQTEQDLADAIVEQIYVRQANGIGINYNTRTAI